MGGGLLYVNAYFHRKEASMSPMGSPLSPAYQAAVDFLYRFIDNSRVRHPDQAAHFSLRRMEALLEHLGNPHRAYGVVHITGTNGKGSVAAMLASILYAAGYRVGLYTSPHLVEFIERIRINGQPIAPQQVVAGVERLRAWAEAHPDISTFELTTGLAFHHFAQQHIDIAVVEVGLGGRYDATNVVTPEVAVITAIDYDHTRLLGPTLAHIAQAKAGIIKPGRPVVTTRQPPEAMQVLRAVARHRGARLWVAADQVHLQVLADDLTGQRLRLAPRGNHARPCEVRLPLLGPYQRENAVVAYWTARVLRDRGWDLSPRALQHGLEQVRWPCRFEVLQADPPLVVDGAHTPAAARALAAGMRHYFPARPWVLIFGVSRTKDPQGLLRALAPRQAHIIATQSIHPKAMPAAQVAAAARALGFPVTEAPTVEDALAQALALRPPEGVVLATGSLFVAAGVRVAFTGQPWWLASLV